MPGRKTLRQGIDAIGNKMHRTLIESNNPILGWLAPGERTMRAVRVGDVAASVVGKRKAARDAAWEHLQNVQKNGTRAEIRAAQKEYERMERRYQHAAAKGQGAFSRVWDVGKAYAQEDPLRALAIYGGGAAGIRLLSGGTLTTNRYGERDIVGIPFI